ncbi:DUF3786 domain-containing protein [Thermodesulfobacteriota bacterium]
MSKLTNPMEIFKLLEKSNCKKCGEPTCLAFAATVFKGQNQLGSCPKLDIDIVLRYAGNVEKQRTNEDDVIESLEKLKKKIAELDLALAAERLDAVYSNGRLTLKICGKNFQVDAEGNMYADIHIHPWIAVPVLNYILHCAGVPLTGKWVPIRELKNGSAYGPLFVQRSEKPLKKIADDYPELFEDMIHLFNGKQTEPYYGADISLILYPLPKVPILFCYWKPDEGMESSINIFFDSSAENNLNIDSVYALGTGLVRMFEKIALKHGALVR